MQKYKWPAAISVLAAIIIIASCKTRFETTRENYKVPATRASFERGKVLVTSICSGCHYDKTVGKFIGAPMHDIPGILGKIYSANLTNSKTNGIPPQYTDVQLKYLLKTGVAKDGRFITYMLRPNMADADLDAIVVYLRSGDGPVAAGDTTISDARLNVIGKTVMNIMAKPLPYNTGIKLPAETNDIATGRYLIDNIGCYHCHSASLTSLNYLKPEESKGYMAGGTKFTAPNGVAVIANNLTPDQRFGIGKLSKMDFRNAVKEGRYGEKELHAPMPQFHLLKDKEVDAIYAYLQTLPANHHNIQQK